MNAAQLKVYLDERFNSQDKELKEIKTQVLETNGRVSDLEKWRAILKGVWITLGIFGLVISFGSGVLFSILTLMK